MKRSPGFIVALGLLTGAHALGQTNIPANSTSAVAGAVAAIGSTTAIVPAIPAMLPVVVTPAMPVVPTTPVRVPASDARITNLSTRARISATSPLMTGFAITGDTSRTVLVRAVGPTLDAFGLSGTLAAPHLKLHDSTGAVVMENAGWADAPALTTAANVAGAFPFARGSADAALVATLAPGTYTVEVGDDAGRGGVVLAEIYDLNKTAPGSHLTNVSTLNTVAPDGGELISGFVISGTSARQFLVRGVGPGLTKLGVGDALSNPFLAVYSSAGQTLAANDDWSGSPLGTAVAVVATPVGSTPALQASENAAVVSTASRSVGAFDLDNLSRDAALVVTLQPGAYTVQVKGIGKAVTTTAAANTAAAVASAAGASAAGSTAGATSPATVAAVVQSAAAAAAQAAVSVTFVPPTPGTALLEIYELP